MRNHVADADRIQIQVDLVTQFLPEVVGLAAAAVAAALGEDLDAFRARWRRWLLPKERGLLQRARGGGREKPTDPAAAAVLSYLGKDPNTENPADYDAVVEAFKPVRQYIKTFDASNYLNAIPNKELCVINNWSGDYATATSRASDAGVEINLGYEVPATGSPAWFDVWAIPKDAKNVENAHKFLNFMLDPEVIAGATNFTYYANANAKADEFVLKEILDDPAIYPNEEIKKRLWTSKSLSPKAQRALTRAWTKIKTGS